MGEQMLTGCVLPAGRPVPVPPDLQGDFRRDGGRGSQASGSLREPVGAARNSVAASTWGQHKEPFLLLDVRPSHCCGLALHLGLVPFPWSWEFPSHSFNQWRLVPSVGFLQPCSPRTPYIPP